MAFDQKYSHQVHFYSHFPEAFSKRQRQQAPKFDHIIIADKRDLHGHRRSLRCIFGALSLLWNSYESFSFCNRTYVFPNRCFKPDLFPLGMNTSFIHKLKHLACAMKAKNSAGPDRLFFHVTFTPNRRISNNRY